MFRFAGIALCVVLHCANAKYKNADEVIMLQTSVVVPAMGEHAAIATDAEIATDAAIATDTASATDEKHDMPQTDVESVNTTSVISTKKTRVHNPVGDEKAILKKKTERLKELKIRAHELQLAYQECTKKESAILQHQSSAQHHFDQEKEKEPTLLEASVQCSRCLDHCVCVNSQRSREECEAIICDKSYLSSAAGSGSTPSSSGTHSNGGADGGSTNGGADSNGGSDGGSTNGGADSAGADSDGLPSESNSDDGSHAGSSDVYDSSAAQEQTESGTDEGKQATAESSGNSGNSGNNEDYGDEETVSDEEAGKSLSFRPEVCLALFVPLVQLL
jgi:hypothetical protein